MMRTAAEIANFLNAELHGNGGTVLESVAGLKRAGPADLSYAEDKFQAEAAASLAGCILVGSGEFPGQTVIRVKHPKVAFAKAAALLFEMETTQPAIHPTAVIEPDAIIGEGTRIGAGCYIGRGVTIGRACVLHARVVVYADAQIGNNVIVHAGAVIGADGFGFVWDGERQVKFPQIGGVIIEDDVEIGANSCIDRGSLGDTLIRRGAKLDNLIQIAHNVEIGEHTVIAAQAGIAGSTTVGARSMLGGQVGIGEHATLDPGSMVGGQGGVLNGKHLHGGEVLWGTPARPVKQFLEQQAALARLPGVLKELRKR